VFWVGIAFLLVVWIGYSLLLKVASFFLHAREKRTSSDIGRSYSVSILIAAHNEESRIIARIKNILSCDYPKDLIEIVVVSDGSNDDTVKLVREYAQRHARNIKIISLETQQGRAKAHNVGIFHCSGDIVVFTDASTEFNKDFLTKIVRPFKDPQVGYVSGTLVYRNQGQTNITQAASLYWRFEFFLRKLETLLGIYVFGSGACCAVRKTLFREIPPTGDVDFTTPLDVVLQGYKCVHLDDAIAYDEMPDSPKREFRARVRMTAKNFHGTITRWGVHGLIRHPIYSAVIFFHKIGRWLTPFAMIGVFISNLFLLQSGLVYQAAFVLQAAFYLLAVLGWMKVPVPLAAQIYSFCLANAGFMVGVLKALVGKVPAAYTPVNKM